MNLFRNGIRTLPTQIEHLVGLQKLDLKQNEITHLPSELTKLSSLTVLELENNPLVFPPIMIVSYGTKFILKYLLENRDPGFFFEKESEQG